MRISTAQSLLGHADVSTTMIYTHVAQLPMGIKSPLDAMAALPPRERITDTAATRKILTQMIA